MSKKIFVCAGDLSGDLQAAYLVDAFKKQQPDIKITAIGGNKLKITATKFLTNIVDAEGFGLNNLLKKYFYFKKVLHNIILPYFLKGKPNLVILVDFYGFNIHVAKAAKQLNIKVVYYVCPQIWASRKYRIHKIKKYVDEVIPIFPFESKMYKEAKIPVHFEGNPSVDIVKASTQNINVYNEFDIPKTKTLIGILPGSRKQQAEKILPVILECLKKLNLDNVMCFLFISTKKNKKLILNILNDYNFMPYVKIIDGPGYSIRKKLRFCLACSGTSTTENLILNLPTIIFYKMSGFAYRIAKLIVKTKYISITNVLANKQVMPEHIQDINTDNIAKLIKKWLEDDKTIEKNKQTLEKLSKKLGDRGMIDRATRHIIDKFLY